MQALPKEKLGAGARAVLLISSIIIPGILCIAIGTLLSIFLGRSYFNQTIVNNGFSPTEITQIDQAVFGHHQSLQQILGHLSPHIPKAP